MFPFFRFVARYARPHLFQYAFGAAMLFATNYAVVRIPALIGDSLNVLQTGGATALRESRDLATELLIWGLVVIVARTLSRVLFFNPGRDVEFRVGLDLFRHFLGLQRPFFARHKVGELVSVSTNDAMALRLLIGFAGLQVCNVAVAIPMHLFQMVRTDVPLTAWCLAPVLVGAIYMRWTVRRFYALVKDSMHLLARLSDRVLETYSGVNTIRAYGVETAAVKRFERRNEAYLALQLRISAIRAYSMPILALSGMVGTGVVLWVGGERVLAGQMRVGDLATFTGLLISLVGILTSLAWVLAAVSRGVVSLGRIDDVFHTGADLPPVTSRLQIEEPPRIELRHLSFTHSGDQTPALSDVSALVEPGRTLGIFGHTGSGKSTLVGLLARIHTPPPGACFIDGHDIRTVPLDDLRESMAVVPQEPYLFSTTLRENVRLSGERSSHDRVAEGHHTQAPTDEAADPEFDRVLEQACLLEDIQALPDGLNTIVGERGVMLSGGQRQRASLARALYRRRPILLLDDILSAVDQGTEARLVAAIRALRHGADGNAPTTIIVSHRTSVLEHADEILVLDRGRVIERGDHRALLARGGLYAKTHQHQASHHD